jgi:hypothetical protein
MRITLALAAAVALGAAAIASSPATAGSRAVADQPSAATAQADEFSAKKRKRYRGYQAYGGTQIACTPFGCRPIPPGCRIITGRTWDGTPSGFDDVICPYR